MNNFVTKSTYIFILFFIAITTSWSQEDELLKIKGRLPKMLGANNAGLDFWITIPPCYEVATNENFIKLFVTSSGETDIHVEIPGKQWLVQKKSIPNDVVEFNLTPSAAECYHHQTDKMPPAEKVYSGYGIHIWADQPLVVYCVVRYKATSDGFLALPTASLGREYISCSYGDMGAMYNGNYPSELGIVSPYNENDVEFTLGGNIVTKTAGGLKPGQTASEKLMKGDVWMFSSYGYEADLTGSIIKSSKPVAVISGNYCANIPITNRWCDYSVEMDVPSFTWGLYYHVPKIPNRKFSSLIRIFAKKPDTKLFRDGIQIGSLETAGGLLGKGWLEMRMVPMGETPKSVVISGDKPIAVTLCNTGVQEDSLPMPNSDPFLMSITPINQYQDEITFATPGINGGQNFKENYVNLVYETDENGEMPEDFLFTQVIAGNMDWKVLRNEFISDDEVFSYDIHGKKFALKTITLPNDGVFKIKAAEPFAAYSFGYDWCDSYGFPTSAANVNSDINDPTPPIINITTGSGKEAGIHISGTTIDMPDNESNRANLSVVLFHDDLGYNYDFTREEFIPGEDRQLKWELNVIDKSKNALAFLTFSDRSGNDTTVYYRYNGARVDSEDGPDGNVITAGFLSESFSLNSANNTVPFRIAEPGNAEIRLFDGNGRLVEVLLSEYLEKGEYSVKPDCSNLSSGNYIIVMSVGNFKASALVRIVK